MRRGTSLLELLITLTIMLVMFGMFAPGYVKMIGKAEQVAKAYTQSVKDYAGGMLSEP